MSETRKRKRVTIENPDGAQAASDDPFISHGKNGVPALPVQPDPSENEPHPGDPVSDARTKLRRFKTIYYRTREGFGHSATEIEIRDSDGIVIADNGTATISLRLSEHGFQWAYADEPLLIPGLAGVATVVIIGPPSKRNAKGMIETKPPEAS